MIRTYLIFYRFLLRYRVRFLGYVVAILVWSIADSIQPYFYKLFIDAIPTGDYQLLIRILLGYIAIRLIDVLADVVTAIFSDGYLLPGSRDARLAVVKKIQDLDFAYHLTKSTGSLISSIKRGDSAFFNLHISLNIRLVRILINFGVLLVFFAALDWRFTALMMASFILNLFLAFRLIKANITAREAFNDAEDEVSGMIVDNLINFETVKLFAKEKRELNRMSTKFGDWLNLIWVYANSFRLIDIVIGVVGNSNLVLILWFGLRQVLNQAMTPGEYIMMLGFVTTFYQRFFELTYELRNVAKYHTDLVKYFEVLDKDTQVQDPADPHELTSVKGEIEFRNVSFSYPEGKQDALRNVHLRIRQGQSVAFVGHSGAGKTSITKLLMRLYDPTAGQILLDGVDIRQFTKSQLRSYMGVVPQEPTLFNNTIAFNIGYGAKKATTQEIEGAAKLANLHDFIMSLPEKYETNVGERGVKLSGGQKQRLAIARMILSNPEIIIFDEATSQLDSESEKLIQEAFWKAAHNKTTLIIAHRLSSIVKAEKIVVMEDGQIKEIGSHRELLHKKDGRYKRFWQLQTEVV